jgi:hypothetical protein
MEKNRRKVIFHGEQDWRGEKFDGDEIPWMTKGLAEHGCRGWKIAEGIVSVVTSDLARRSMRNRSCWMLWAPGTR